MEALCSKTYLGRSVGDLLKDAAVSGGANLAIRLAAGSAGFGAGIGLAAIAGAGAAAAREIRRQYLENQQVNPEQQGLREKIKSLKPHDNKRLLLAASVGAVSGILGGGAGELIVQTDFGHAVAGVFKGVFDRFGNSPVDVLTATATATPIPASEFVAIEMAIELPEAQLPQAPEINLHERIFENPDPFYSQVLFNRPDISALDGIGAHEIAKYLLETDNTLKELNINNFDAFNGMTNEVHHKIIFDELIRTHPQYQVLMDAYQEVVWLQNHPDFFYPDDNNLILHYGPQGVLNRLQIIEGLESKKLFDFILQGHKVSELKFV